MVLKEDIRGAFSAVGLHGVNDDILSKCVGLASTLHTSPKKMAEVWEAHSLTKKVTELTDHTFQAFRNELLKHADGAVVARPGLGKRNLPMVTPPSNKRHQGSNGNNNALVDSVATRVCLSPTKSMVTPQQPHNFPKYNERKNVDKVEVSFNPNDLPSTETTDATPSRCVVSYSFDSNVQEPYRHMFTTLEERAEALDNHLVCMGDKIVERYGIGEEGEEVPLEAVGVPGEQVVRCIGRICNEAHEGKLNSTSVVLEGCRHVSNGCRINVDLSKVKEAKMSFSVFPGQIVAVEGVNNSGREIVAHRICEGAAHSSEKTSVESLIHYHHDLQNGQPLKLMTICGPYTTSDNLDYAPLQDLLLGVQREKPDVVIMAGPFVDMRHAEIKEGDMTMDMEDGTKMTVDYDTFFSNKVAAMIEGAYEEEELHTQFVLVPSMEDANAEWVYPQAPLTDRVPNGGKDINLPLVEGLEFGTLGLHHVETAGGGGSSSKQRRRVHCVSNPCTLRVNEVVIGVSSTDTLFDMNKNETNANLEPGTRLGRIAQHLLQQQSYYPLFPPEETSMDLKHMDQWSMPCQPDILIVPSKLMPFARKVLDKTVAINPGHLSRGTTGGTYATMDIHPIKRETLENAGGASVEMEHGVQDRIRVEIKRI